MDTTGDITANILTSIGGFALIAAGFVMALKGRQHSDAISKYDKENPTDGAEAPMSEGVGDFEDYHETYTSAINAAIKYASEKGWTVVEDDIWREIATGYGKPSPGKTIKHTINLTNNKTGNPPRGKNPKALQIQVYNRETQGKPYELTAYIL